MRDQLMLICDMIYVVDGQRRQSYCADSLCYCVASGCFCYSNGEDVSRKPRNRNAENELIIY